MALHGFCKPLDFSLRNEKEELSPRGKTLLVLGLERAQVMELKFYLGIRTGQLQQLAQLGIIKLGRRLDH